MSKIYLANATKQNLCHQYRLPESNRVYRVDIPSGRQVMMGEDWSQASMDFFIKHLHIAGFKQASDANRKIESFSGWMYSTTKPIGEDSIHSGHDEMVRAQEERAASEATMAAMAFDMSNRPKNDRRKRLAKVTQIQVEQETGPRAMPSGDEIRMDVTFDESSNAQLKV